MYKRMLRSAVWMLCALVIMLLSGCRANMSLRIGGYISGEDYPDAEKYQTGTFAYDVDEVRAVEIYWRSGEVEIIESDRTELSVKESDSKLPVDTAMHYFLDDGILRIRFCGSGAKIRVNEADKHLSLEVPKGIDLSVHTTSALIKAEALSQNDILIAALSGRTELGTVTAENVDLSSSSGNIQVDNISAKSLKCSASSGSVDVGTVSAGELECGTSSGSIRLGNIVSETVKVTTSSGGALLGITEASDVMIHTSSGKVDLALPGGGAQVLYTSNSGKLHTNCTYNRRGDLYVFGSGESNVTIETSSGSLKIQ